MTVPSVNVRIRSCYEEIPLVRRVMSSLREDVSLTYDALLKVEICVVEVVGNAIRHAYGLRGDGIVEVSFEILDDRFVIEVTDSGQTMSPHNQRLLTHGPQPVAPDRLPVQEIPEGGMGFPILRAVLDGLEYTSEGKRNTLRMTKLRDQVPAPAL